MDHDTIRENGWRNRFGSAVSITRHDGGRCLIELDVTQLDDVIARLRSASIDHECEFDDNAIDDAYQDGYDDALVDVKKLAEGKTS